MIFMIGPSYECVELTPPSGDEQMCTTRTNRV